MSLYFEELDYRQTPIGELSLRKRRELRLDVDVYEIKLGEEFLMSSLFTASERALARLAMAELGPGTHDVVVGGLGLGYTAQAALAHESVHSLLVVEALQPVIDWHEQGLLPIGRDLSRDNRCRFRKADFFALAASREGFDDECSGRCFDAVLLDIDHSPDLWLDANNGAFYRHEGLQAMARHLRPGGIFGLWSDAAPDTAFTERLEAVFEHARAEAVSFHNPLIDCEHTQTVYLARA